MRLVVDASALLRLADEANREGATGAVSRELARWHEVFEVSAPALVAYEVANVIHRKWAGGADVGEERRRDLVRDVLHAVSLVPPDPAATARIGALTESLGLTAYDAAYVELADRDVDSVLVTEDRPLTRKAALLLGDERVFALADRYRDLAA